MPSMKRIISGHNKKILKGEETAPLAVALYMSVKLGADVKKKD